MYKIFINNSLLFLGKKAKKGTITFDYDKETLDFHELVEQVNMGTQVSVLSQEPELLWNDFNKEFNIIHAAGGVVLNSQKEILVIHRLGLWDLPKGKVEKGETFRETAVREVEEECGISQVKIKNFYSSTYHMYPYESAWALKLTHWYQMVYSGEERLLPQKEEGIEKAEWVSPKKLKKNIYRHTYKNIQLIIKQHLKQSK